MPLKNFTTSIDVHKTLGEIQGILARGGAKSVTVVYSDEGEPSGLEFSLTTPAGLQFFRLPMRGEKVFAVLTYQYESGQVRRAFVTKQQAARVGWRIIKDWIDAQLAIVETEMVSLPEVMMPYMIGANNQSLYDAFLDNRLALPEAGKK